MLRLRARRAAVLSYAATAALATAACDDRKGGTAARPPAAEFLVATADSTYWVTSGAGGVRLRGSPLALTRYEGRFHELYVADDDHSYYDALFVGQRIYRRDLVTGDSVAVFDDATVRRLARRYGARHPEAERLSPDQEASDDPRAVATAEVEILDAHGPYVSFEYRADVDVDGEEEVHSTRRGVIDLRTGAEARLATLFGEESAALAAARGRAAFAAALDSVRASHDRRARRAAAALANFVFDEESFSLAAEGQDPAVLFLVPGRGALAEGLALPLPPVAAPAPGWWGPLRETLPSRSEPQVDVWRRRGYAVSVRYGAPLDAARVVVSDSAGRRWAAGRLSSPALHIHWLDDGTLDPAARHGLARAFEESVFYSEEVRSVMNGGVSDQRPAAGGRPGSQCRPITFRCRQTTAGGPRVRRVAGPQLGAVPSPPTVHRSPLSCPPAPSASRSTRRPSS